MGVSNNISDNNILIFWYPRKSTSITCHDGELYDGESHDGESYDGELYDGELYDGEQHYLLPKHCWWAAHKPDP